MSVLTDRTPQVIAYLLAQSAIDPNLGAATPAVVIIDGQPKNKDVLALNPVGLTQRLWVGSGGYVAPGQMDTGGDSDQGFAFLDQARTRDNAIEVDCAAEAITGDTDMAAARNGAFAVMAGIELMLRGSVNTSPASPGDSSMDGLVQWSEVAGPITLSQGQLAGGAVALVRFKVSAFVRLTS